MIALLVKTTIGLRVPPEIERQGIDINLHDEEGYITSGLLSPPWLGETCASGTG